jgi:hypothetical protein
MIETKQLDAEVGRALLRLPVIAGANEKAAPRAFFGRIRQRHEIGDRAVASEQRAAAFVRVGLLAVRADRLIDRRRDRQRPSDARLKGSRSFGSRSFGSRSFGSRFFSH